MRGIQTSQRRFRIGMLAGLLVFPSGCTARPSLPLEQIHLPPGFRISLYADEVPGARSLARGDRGTIFVGTRGQGVVYALTDADGDGRAERTRVIARGRVMPNGVAFRDGSLYVAEIHRITRYDKIEERLDDPPVPVVVRDDFPRNPHHGWKFIAFGPDGRLYVPVGAPCNLCEREDPYATILRMRPDGSDREVFARGVRNTLGFDWQPGTGVLWFTDNGRDRLGDHLPPDELNAAPRAGLNFGFPYCYGQNVPDPKFGRRDCSGYTPATLDLDAHVAALGMRFYTGTQFPPDYRNAIVIAEHGSWNRSSKIGYRVIVVRVDGERVMERRVFAQGWLQGERAWGRPVDVLVMPDGALLVSDDRAGAVYRIFYPGDEAAPHVRTGENFPG